MRLIARLVQPGRNGGWVAGPLSWSKLDTLHYYGGYLTPQVRLLQEIYALYRSRGSGYYSYGDEKWLDLTAFESSRLWPILDEADAIGLRLVYPRKLGPVEKYRDATFSLDVTRARPSGALVITPVIQAGEDRTVLRLVRFIGTQGHGLVYADPAEAERTEPAGWRFRLARLTRPVPEQLQRMALAGQRLEVPAAEQARFCQTYYPRLRHAVSVSSSDGTFTPPDISPPTLVLRASYGAGHDVDLAWEWAYQVGGARMRSPLAPDPAGGYRDPAAERMTLASLDLPLAQFGLLKPGPPASEPGPVLAPQVRFGGVDTMRFTTELLPMLADHPGVAVEVTGEVAGETDWFDLGVTLWVEGRQIPFADVFVALSRGEQVLLLPDGAYFSLDKPELRALAGLIEEARALRDAPDGELRISRFQAGLWDELASLGVVERQASAWQRQVQGLLSAGTIGGAQPPATLRARLRIKPLVKRRTKEQVAAELPPKQEQVLEVELHPRHRKLYQTYLQRERQKVLGLIGDLNTHRFTILRSLTLLRQLSLHAGLVDGTQLDLPCSKLDALLDQLRDVVGGGHRALVFSQFTAGRLMGYRAGPATGVRAGPTGR